MTQLSATAAPNLDALDDDQLMKSVIKHISGGKNYRYYTVDGEPYLDLRRYETSAMASAFNGAVATVAGTSQARRLGLCFPVAAVASLAMRLRADLEEGYETLSTVDPELERVFEIIDEAAKGLREAYEDRRAKGLMESGDVPLYFTKGMEVVQAFGSNPVAGIVESVKYVVGWRGNTWVVQVSVVHALSGNVQEGLYSLTLPDWEGIVEAKDLPLRPLQDGDKVKLAARAAFIGEIAAGPTYLRYTGELEQNSWFGPTHFRAEGRVMVDANTCKRLDSDRARKELENARIQEELNPAGVASAASYVVNDADLWRVYPYVLGFSFRCKKWGVLRMSELSPVQWREDAFTQLVMDRDQKDLIKALVQHSSGTFQDIIDEKGGGTIFLLEGPPGEGKTLTAESVAEMRKQPLYAISIGELGTEPDVLEERLREILDVATVWNAVLLLDEADIFLEARNANDIVRNAMVGVFLRLLEYHQGILFLTTNRANNLDPAILSRISVLLSFAKGGPAKRQRIWANLLQAAGVWGRFTNGDLKALAARDVNGRQIKNAIRIGQALARAEGRPLRRPDLERPLQLAEDFQVRVRASTRRGLWARLRGVFKS